MPNLVAIAVKPLLKYRTFSIFKIAAVLVFKKCEILTAGRIQRINMRYHVKFRVSHSNHYGDIAIFLLSKWRPSASWICYVHVMRLEKNAILTIFVLVSIVENNCGTDF